MRAGRLETVLLVAHAFFVNVKSMLTGRQPGDFKADQHAGRQLLKRGGADLNPLRVAKNGVGRLLGMHRRPARHHPGESSTHKPSRNS